MRSLDRVEPDRRAYRPSTSTESDASGLPRRPRPCVHVHAHVLGDQVQLRARAAASVVGRADRLGAATTLCRRVADHEGRDRCRRPIDAVGSIAGEVEQGCDVDVVRRHPGLGRAPAPIPRSRSLLRSGVHWSRSCGVSMSSAAPSLSGIVAIDRWSSSRPNGRPRASPTASSACRSAGSRYAPSSGCTRPCWSVSTTASTLDAPSAASSRPTVPESTAGRSAARTTTTSMSAESRPIPDEARPTVRIQRATPASTGRPCSSAAPDPPRRSVPIRSTLQAQVEQSGRPPPGPACRRRRAGVLVHPRARRRPTCPAPA